MSKQVKQNSVNAPKYSAVTGDTTYYDFSDITKIPSKYSYSSVFYSENTEFIIYSSAGTLSFFNNRLADGKESPSFSGFSSGTIKMLITNSAVNQNGQVLWFLFSN